MENSVNKDLVLPLLSSILLLVVSVAYVRNFLGIAPNYHLFTFFLGFIYFRKEGRKYFFGFTIGVILLTNFIVLSGFPGFFEHAFERYFTQILVLPLGSVLVFLVGMFLGKILIKYWKFLDHAAFVLLILLSSLILFKTNWLIIPIGSLIAFAYGYHASNFGISNRNVLLIFSFLPVISVILFALDLNFFFWSVSVPFIIGTYAGIVLGNHLSKLGGTLKRFSFGFLFLIFVSALLPIASINVVYKTQKTEWEADKPIPDFPFLYNRDTLMLSDLSGRVVVLDFWHTKCRACFKKFPDFEKLSLMFESEEEVLILATNSPLRTDKAGEAQAIMNNLGYSFENIYLLSDSVATALGVRFYPSIVVINKDQTELVVAQLELSPIIYNITVELIRRFRE